MCASLNPSQTAWHPVPGVTAGLPQAWVPEWVFSHLLQWFWISECSPASVHFHLALSLECCVSWLCAHGFVCLPTRAALYWLLCILSLLGVLELDTVPKGTVASTGWSCALCSPQPSFPLMVGDCELALCWMGHTSIWKGQLGLLPDFFFYMLLRNQTQYYLTPPDLQCRTHCTRGKELGFFLFLLLFSTFFLLQEITHFSAVGEGSNWSRALQLAFRNGFILNVGIKLC